MRVSLPFLLSLVFIATLSSSQHTACGQGAVLPACEWCGAAEAPADLSWQTTIAGPDEPGEPLVITGTVYQPDGQTPAPDVVLYIYHTNEEGIYPKRGDETGNGRRHGYLRSWLRTNEHGQYQFTTIRPRAYPSGTEPAHIHMTVKQPDKDEYWIDSIVFEGDPLLTPDDLESAGLIRLTRDEAGVWRGHRDLALHP